MRKRTGESITQRCYLRVAKRSSRAPILLLVIFVASYLSAQQIPLTKGNDSKWSFAVSGDSRNCGDIVMPAIAQGVRRDGASFYWHLGDYRAVYTFDEDYLHIHPGTTISEYLTNAWPDFISHQLQPFGGHSCFSRTRKSRTNCAEISTRLHHPIC